MEQLLLSMVYMKMNGNYTKLEFFVFMKYACKLYSIISKPY